VHGISFERRTPLMGGLKREGWRLGRLFSSVFAGF